jgi:hypothetical protein
MKSKTLLLMLGVAAACLLAACQFQAFTTIQANGSGELRTEVGFTAEERQNLEEQSEDSGSQDFCNSSKDSAGVTVTEEQRGNETWCVTTTKFDNLDELQKLYEEKKGLTINRLEIVDNKFYYDIEIDTASESSDFSTFNAITWTVTLPGTPSYYNTEQVKGNTITWTPEPRSGTVNFRAESAVNKSGLAPSLLINLGIMLCLCGVAVLGGVGGFFLMRRSRKRARSN